MDNLAETERYHHNQQQHDHRLSIFSRYPERSLFIRDLPFSCTSQDLKKFAAEQTQLPIIRTMVCDNKQQKTLHFGYILLSSEDLVPSAVEKLNGKRFVGRDIKAQPFRSNVTLETANTGVIHVGFRGLKAEIPLITEEVLRSYLESFGELDQIVIRNLLYTKEGNQCGYAFVSFADMPINHHVVESVRQVKVSNIVYQFSWSRHHVLSGSVGGQQPHQHDPNECSKQTKANSVEPEAPDSARLSLEGDLSVSVIQDQPTVDSTQSKLHHNQSSRSFNYSSSSSHSSHSTPRASSSHQSWMGKKERFLTNPTVPTPTHRTAAIPSPTPRSSTSLYAQPSTGFPPSPTYHPPGAVVPLLNIGGNPPSFGFISVPSGYPAPDVGSPQYNTHPTPSTGLPYPSPITAGQNDGISVYYTSMNPPMSTSSPSQSSLHPPFHPTHPTGPGSNPMFSVYGLTASHPHTVQSIPFYHQGAIGPPQVLYQQSLSSPAQSYPSVSVNNSLLPPPATHSLPDMQRNFAQQPHTSNSFQQQSPQQGQISHAPQLPHSHQLSSHPPQLTQQHQHAHPHHNQQPLHHQHMLPSQPHPSPQQHQQQHQQQQSPHQPPHQQPPHQQMPHQPQHPHGLPPNLQHMPHQSSSMPTNHSMYPSNHHPSLRSNPQYPFSSMESPSNASGFYSSHQGPSSSSSTSSATRHPQQLPPPPSLPQHPQQHSQPH